MPESEKSVAKMNATLARAKREAPGYAKKKKIQSCNAERPRQRERQKKVYLAKNNFARLLSTLFLHFFAVVLLDYNVKLLSYTFYGGNVVCVPVRFFFKNVIYTFVAASISQFLTAGTKFSIFSSNEIRLLCFLSLC